MFYHDRAIKEIGELRQRSSPDQDYELRVGIISVQPVLRRLAPFPL